MHSAQHAILHMDLDSFFVSCERILDSRLKDRPVLIGGVSDRGVVASCSYEARQFGIRSAMPMRLARQLCPEAVVIRGNSGTYMKFSEDVTEIIKEYVPVYEKASIDEFYVDLSGMDRYFGCYQYATELRTRIIKETHLPISFGLSINKTVSKIATGEAKPNNRIQVEAGGEKPFLAPLSVRKIPMVGDSTFQMLCHMGLQRIGTIQEIPIELMEKAFGKNGITLWKKASGIDNTPVIPYNERKSISTERTFDRDTIEVTKLRSILTAMAENLAFQLRRGQRLTSCVTVKVRYSDFQTKTLQCRLPYTSADHILIRRVKELFDKLYNRRMLVRLVGVRYSGLVAGNYQMDLFEDEERTIQLYQAMDRIRSRFGDRSVVRAEGMEARTIGRANPFTGEPPPLLAHRHQ
ncbi:MAG: DNA polymerase IV [Bacteroidota bacterium]